MTANAQETPLGVSSQPLQQAPQLKLYNGDFTRPPYTLATPSITTTPVAPSLMPPPSAEVKEHSTYFGLAPRPSDYNFSHNFNLNSNYAAGAITTWQGGGIFASSAMNTFPGMGNIATGAVSVTQDFGRFSITGSIVGSKYHLDNQLYNSYGVSGHLSYQLSDRITLNAFGNYQHHNGFYHSMQAMPYIARSSYGATMGMQMSDKFSMEVGVQRYYDPFSKKWFTTPIVIPQIDINGHKLGIDFGGLIYQVVHSLLKDYTSPNPMQPGRAVMPRMASPHPFNRR